jgi:hypothetical protein
MGHINDEQLTSYTAVQGIVAAQSGQIRDVLLLIGAGLRAVPNGYCPASSGQLITERDQARARLICFLGSPTMQW